MEPFLLEARDISVEFPGVKALDHVDFLLLPGVKGGVPALALIAAYGPRRRRG